LQRRYGPIPVVFLLGACGDITQVDNQSSAIEKGHAHADIMGATLAAEVSRAIDHLSWHRTAACAVANESVSIPIRAVDACAPPTCGLGAGAEWTAIYARECQHVVEMRALDSQIECHFSALRITPDLAIITNGAELFCQPSLDIQQASPFHQTWVTTLTNEYLGYVPTASAHFAGGYEVRTARSSFLAVDAAQKIVETSLRLLHSFAR
jgi:hypothetical protein